MNFKNRAQQEAVAINEFHPAEYRPKNPLGSRTGRLGRMPIPYRPVNYAMAPMTPGSKYAGQRGINFKVNPYGRSQF